MSKVKPYTITLHKYMKILRFLWKYKIGAIVGALYPIGFLFVVLQSANEPGLIGQLFYISMWPVFGPLLQLVFFIDSLLNFGSVLLLLIWSISSMILFLFVGAGIEFSIRKLLRRKI